MQRYDFQDVQNGWRKIGDAPVLGDWSTGTLYDPWTICHNKELFMFVSERKTGNIVLFKSKNGQEWKKKATIIYPHMISLNILLVDRPCVIYKNNESGNISVSWSSPLWNYTDYVNNISVYTCIFWIYYIHFI